jgi:hypothetical protein
MPPKSANTKKTNKSKDDGSDSGSNSDSSVASDVKPKVVADKKKTVKETKPEKVVKTVKVVSDKDAKDKKADWREVSDDDDQASLEKHADAGKADDSGDDVFADDDVHDRPQKGKRNTNSFLNFLYADYENVTTPVNETSTVDLLRVLTARANSEGQTQFCRSLRDVLKALNFEGEFPRCAPPFRPFTSTRGGAGVSRGRGAPFTRPPMQTDAPRDARDRFTPDPRETRFVSTATTERFSGYRDDAPRYDRRSGTDAPRMMRDDDSGRRPPFRGASGGGGRGGRRPFREDDAE